MNRTEFEAASRNDKFLYLYDLLHVQEAPKPKPAEWSNTTVTERPWKPVGTGEVYWTDEAGFTVPRSDVPEDVIAKWEAGKAGETNGES